MARSLLSRMLDVAPGEGRRLFLLMALHFCFGISAVTTETAAYALFIDALGPENLPWSYLSMALGVSLVTVIYLKLDEHFPFSTTLKGTLIFALVVSGLLWLGISLSNAAWLAAIAPIWDFLLANLASFVVWTLAGQLFDIRQSKRLYGPIGAGRWIAFVIGGLLIPFFVQLFGTRNLFLVAVVSVLVASGIVLILLRDVDAPAPAKKAAATSLVMPPRGMLRGLYIWLIFGTTAAWLIVMTFIYNVFFELGAVRYPDIDQLAEVGGLVGALGGMIALTMNLVITSRAIRRFGLAGLLMPAAVLVLLTMLALSIAGTLGSQISLLFLLAFLARLVISGISMSLNVSGQRILYQPLAPSVRARAGAFSDGIVEPVAVGIAGLALLGLNAVPGFGYLQQAYLTVLVTAIWAAISWMSVRAYPRALSVALSKRRLAEGIDIDRSGMSVLRETLHSSSPEAVVHGLNVFEELDREALVDVLPGLLEHPSPDVREHVLNRISQLHIDSALPAVQKLVATEPLPAVRAAALRALAALGEEAVFEQLLLAVDDPHPRIRQDALVALLRDGGLDGILAAGQKLTALLQSQQADQRLLAAHVLGEVGLSNFYQPLLALLSDPDVAVRRVALEAAARVQHPRLWSEVVEALADPAVHSSAAQALVSGGEQVLPLLAAKLEQPDLSRTLRLRLIAVCGRRHSPLAAGLLEQQFAASDPDIRSQVLAALSACRYRSSDPSWLQHISAEADYATALLAALAELKDHPDLGLLTAGLRDQVRQSSDRILLMLSLIYQPQTVLRAREVLSYGAPHQRAYALEALETLLPRELRAVLSLLDETAAEAKLQRLQAIFPQPSLSAEQWLEQLLSERHAAWVLACASAAVAQRRLEACRPALQALLAHPERYVRKITDWALIQLDQARLVEQKEAAMFSLIERVLILKTVNIFAQTPDHVLAEIALLLEELELHSGETLFQKGEPGSCLYIIISGRLRVYDDELTRGYKGDREVIGEMALLDAEPRVASVMAVEDTYLFLLNQEPFFELMAERMEVMRGIMRVIMGNLRRTTDEVTSLHARVQELERALALTTPQPTQPETTSLPYSSL